jgi:tyrosyl-tRNA synthetase
MKINTDSNKIQEVLTRGVENIYPNKEFLEKKLSVGEQLTIYTGYDPTAPSLHIGHGITMMKLRQLQDMGHKIIALIGDFTAMIGDPTDKSAARQQLTREEVLANCQEYQKQMSGILNFSEDNPVEIK